MQENPSLVSMSWFIITKQLEGRVHVKQKCGITHKPVTPWWPLQKGPIFTKGLSQGLGLNIQIKSVKFRPQTRAKPFSWIPAKGHMATLNFVHCLQGFSNIIGDKVTDLKEDVSWESDHGKVVDNHSPAQAVGFSVLHVFRQSPLHEDNVRYGESEAGPGRVHHKPALHPRVWAEWNRTIQWNSKGLDSHTGQCTLWWERG